MSVRKPRTSRKKTAWHTEWKNIADEMMPKVDKELKQLFGHPRFYELTALEEDLHSRKNEDYAGGGPPMGNFERVSKFLAQYPNFPVATPHGVAIVYMMKQLDAALWLIANNKKGNIEGVAERLGDIGVYAKIIRILYEESQK